MLLLSWKARRVVVGRTEAEGRKKDRARPLKHVSIKAVERRIHWEGASYLFHMTIDELR